MWRFLRSMNNLNGGNEGRDMVGKGYIAEISNLMPVFLLILGSYIDTHRRPRFTVYHVAVWKMQ
jgi:hypothetical protein